AEEMHGGIARGHDRAASHISSRDKRNRALRVHVVGAILGVVFGDENDRVVLVAAPRHLLRDKANSVVVVSDFGFDRVDAAKPLGKRAEMVVRQAKEGQRWQISAALEFVEFAGPPLIEKEIGLALVETMEIGVGDIAKRGL